MWMDKNHTSVLWMNYTCVIMANKQRTSEGHWHWTPWRLQLYFYENLYTTWEASKANTQLFTNKMFICTDKSQNCCCKSRYLSANTRLKQEITLNLQQGDYILCYHPHVIIPFHTLFHYLNFNTLWYSPKWKFGSCRLKDQSQYGTEENTCFH